MKVLFITFIISLTLSIYAQPIQTIVETRGLVLRDQTDADRMILDGDLNLISIQINDSLLLDIRGDLITTIKCVNTHTQIETGMELYPDGSFAFGEFNPAPSSRPNSVLNIRNGLFRPAPDTQALATGSMERLRITETGDIGIGVQDPTAILDINGSLRIRNLPINENLDFVLALDEFGNVNARPISSILPGVSNSSEAELKDLIQKQDQLIEALTDRIEKLEKALRGV